MNEDVSNRGLENHFTSRPLLLVDDDRIFSKLVSHALMKTGYDVVVAHDGDEALEVLGAQTFDLVLLDYMMGPGMDGLAVLRKLRERGDQTAAIMLTGAGDEALVVEAMHIGVLDYLKKETSKSFLNRIKHAIQRALHTVDLEREMLAARNRLEESERRHRQLFLQCKAPQLIIDPANSQIVDANEAAIEFYGYSIDEITARKISDLNILSADEIQAEMQRAVDEKRSHFFFRHRLADGSTRDVEVHSGPIHRGGQTLLYSIIHDISERRYAETMVAIQNATLEKVAQGASLQEIFGALIPRMEQVHDGVHYAAFSVAPSGAYKLESAPHLPEKFHKDAISLDFLDECLLLSGACARKDFDPFDRPRCVTCGAREWLIDHEIHHILTEPIKSPKGNYIGVFAAFVLPPGGEELRIKACEIMRRNSHLVGIALEHDRAIRATRRQAKFLQTVIDAVPTPIYYKDDQGRYTGFNRALEDFMGHSREEIIGARLTDFYPDDDLSTFLESDKILMERGGDQIIEGCVTNKDKNLRHIEVHKAKFEDPEGNDGIVGTIVDITERKLHEYELRLSATVFETTSEAIVVSDAKNRIQAVNPSFTAVTGYSEEEVVGRDPGFLSSGRHDKTFYDRMWRQLCETGRWQGEIWNRRKNGHLYAEWLSISAVYDETGEICQYVAVFSDITKRKKAEELIRHQANYDALTNLPNRNLFLDRLSRAIMRARRNEDQVGLMFIDLDRFKWVNDTLGHNVGDQLLQSASARLSRCVRESDTVARLGGDEFTIVLPDLKRATDAEVIARKILEELAKPFNISGNEIFVSGSIGITIFPQDGGDLELLLRNADTAMYRAKEAGRNAFCFFTQEMNEAAHQQMVLEGELRGAIERDEFVVHYQPVVDAETGHVVSAEALVRWNHPTRGLLPPGVFIDIAEETGLIEGIGDSVLRQTCEQLREWKDDPVLRTIRIAVNLSPRQLQNESVVHKLAGLLENYGLSGDQLGLEVTETLVMQDPERAAKLLRAIRELGIKVSLDDFGTGYSSLNYLKRFDFDVLKIDRSFILDLERDEGDAALVEAIIVMAHKLGIKVVAEGVENDIHLRILVEHACDFIQGYYFSKPLPQDIFKTYCLSRLDDETSH